MAGWWRARGALSYGVGGERRLRDPDASSSLLPLRPNGHFPPAIALVCVAGDVDADSLPVLFVEGPGRLPPCVVAKASALITGEDYHAQNGFNARGARHEPSETFEFPVVSLSGGPGEDMRSRARTPAAVWADPFLSHIWAGNGSTGPRLSGCVGPLGCVFTIFMFTWTRSDARWSNGSARWRCPKERVECPVGSE
jgi:hypothetical protein